MDLEQRLAEAVDLLTKDRAPEVLSERFTFDVGGAKGGRDEALAWLAKLKPADSTLRVVSVKRNLMFLDWKVPAVGAGMAIVAWDQDGRVASVSARRR